MLACERGNKLSEVEDRTEQLATDSKVRNTVRDNPSCDVKCNHFHFLCPFVCFSICNIYIEFIPFTKYVNWL